MLLYFSEPNTSSSRKAAKTLLKSNSVHSSAGSSSGGVMEVSMIVPRHTGSVLRMCANKAYGSLSRSGARLIVRIGADRHLCLPGSGI